MIKNLESAQIMKLDEQVDYATGQVVSKTLSQNKNVSLTLFAFDQHEGLSTHTSTGDALVQVLDGMVEIVIDDTPYTLHKGETICMPANVPHSLYATTRFKMLLTVVFAQ
ncbi:cupin [Erysipelothrix larvae]|uniref:Cupin n=1 Tax=Erysipelothrix larvae TaxID=1514105 RepID=A0A0X8H169_9FIRM|nr:cupin domain-containing protein [Erysipelothrix larvae]AMC94115.1 cupin [Erysipelothrix larvae]